MLPARTLADTQKPVVKTSDKQKRAAPRGPARPLRKPPARQARATRRAPSPKRRAPKGRPELANDVAEGPDQACHAQLRKADVSFVKILAERAPDVRLPIRLTGAVAGVEIRGAGKNRATHYLDCRLAQALLRWAPQ
ncbi:MAG TPA: hypothetical protein VFZ61_17395, partial [Polyangiales bacterium]